jgi:hypothetical protein
MTSFLHWVQIDVNKRSKLTPPSLGRSMAWLADRRRDPMPINTSTIFAARRNALAFLLRSDACTKK